MNKIALTMMSAAGLIIGLATLPAEAQEMRVKVSTKGLNIATTNGAHELAYRVDRNISKACARDGNIADLLSTEECRIEMLDNASAELRAQGHALAARDVKARI